MRMTPLVALALACIASAATDVAPARAQLQQGGSTAEVIAGRNRQFVDAFKRGDAAALAALYSDDGQALPPNGGVVTGREGLAALWKGAMDMGIKSVALETTELFPGGDMATEVGRYKLMTADGTVADEGKYVVVWKRVGGSWYLHRDIWNSSRPAAK